MLVRLALSTALRRGVLLQLKWSDIDFDKKIINIDKRYYTEHKPSPPMVPISARMGRDLRDFYKSLPDQENKPSCKLFPNSHELDRMHGKETPDLNYDTGWCDDTWRVVIRYTTLWEPFLDQDNKHIMDEDGEPVKDWLHFHDLRHTAITRYAEEDTYDLGIKQYHYLQGKGEKYNHPDAIKMCNSIRQKIDQGDFSLYVKPYQVVHTDEHGVEHVSGRTRARKSKDLAAYDREAVAQAELDYHDNGE